MLRKKERFRVFENRMQRRICAPKRDEVTGGWRKLHSSFGLFNKMSRRSTDSRPILSNYRLDDRGSISDMGQRVFLLATASITAPGPPEPPIQWVPQVLSKVSKYGRGVALTTNPNLVPSSSYTYSHSKLLHGV
jgi:hypothetical protein